jgi:hypothetical protein
MCHAPRHRFSLSLLQADTPSTVNKCSSVALQQNLVADGHCPAQDMVIASANDADLALDFRKVSQMVAPPEALFAPGVLGKVILFRFRRFFGRLFQRRSTAPETSFVK